MDVSEYYTIDEDGTVHIKDDTPPKIFSELANSDDCDVVEAVVRNPNTPVNVLLKIVINLDELGFEYDNSEDYPFDIIARSDKFSARKLTALAKSNHYEYRMVAARNPKTPIKVLEDLYNDNACTWEDYFQEHSIQEEGLCPTEETFDAMSILQALCWNPSTPEDILRGIAELKDQWGEKGFDSDVIDNPNAPIDVLANVAIKDKKFMKRVAIKALDELAKNADEADQAAARKALETFAE